MNHEDHAASRRTLLAGVAAGGLALPVLAACGGGSDSGGGSSSDLEPTTPSGSASGSASADAEGTAYTASEIPVGGGKIDKTNKVVVTQPSEGEFKAFSAVCTHQGCIVSKIADKEIDCACHGSRFSITDGSVKHGPASKPLEEKTATVSGKDVVVA